MKEQKRLTPKQRKERIYINEYIFDGDRTIVKTYTKTREELSKIEGYHIIFTNEDKTKAKICDIDDKDKIDEYLR